MANLYLIIDEKNKVAGCQATKGEINSLGYIKVDEGTYNRFGELKDGEYITYEMATQKFTTHPDPRPVIRIQAPISQKMGEKVNIQLEQILIGREEKTITKDAELMIEYEFVAGHIGLIRVVFSNGKASVFFVPEESGYYFFGNTPNYKMEQTTTIAVYE